MQKVTSYFEIDARADMAYDLDTGEGVPAYLQVATEHSKVLTDDEIAQVRGVHRRMVANQLELPEEYFKPITKEEYDAETEDDEINTVSE